VVVEAAFEQAKYQTGGSRHRDWEVVLTLRMSPDEAQKFQNALMNRTSHLIHLNIQSALSEEDTPTTPTEKDHW